MPVIEALFKDYWGMGNYNAHTSYLHQLMASVTIKRRRKPAEESSRTQRILYSVIYGNKHYNVCKKAFMAIFGIGDKRVRVVLKKLTLGKTTVADKRGTNARVSKFSGEKADLVREHIKTLPTLKSHYYRAKSRNRMYMESNLSVVKLYDMYVKFIKDEHPNVDIVSFNYYSNVFRTEFNIGFMPQLLIHAAPVIYCQQIFQNINKWVVNRLIWMKCNLSWMHIKCLQHKLELRLIALVLQTMMILWRYVSICNKHCRHPS